MNSRYNNIRNVLYDSHKKTKILFERGLNESTINKFSVKFSINIANVIRRPLVEIFHFNLRGLLSEHIYDD